MEESEMYYRVPATGERAAMSGYTGQYTEFACRVYDCMQSDTLVEVRVADAPEKVGILDDICYVTTTEVHAYQIKWTINNETFGYSDFISLIPDIMKSWIRVKNLYPQLPVYPHLLTNRRGTVEGTYITDSQGNRIGQFPAFREEVVATLKRGKTPDSKWTDVISQLRATTSITDEEFAQFWKMFIFTTDYRGEELPIRMAKVDQDTRNKWDLIAWIIEKVSSDERRAPFSCYEIRQELGWDKRNRFNFNHNLSVDVEKYEPNKQAIELLNAKLSSKSKGYIFLEGTPGSGKSTILTSWIQSILNPHIQYYAFDFTRPSSQLDNNSERGESLTFLYDIVLQLQNLGYKPKDTVNLRKDFVFLKGRFQQLLQEAGEEAQVMEKPMLIIVDGLDHIHREYTTCEHSLLEVLPTSEDLPDGIIFVLGSQYYSELGLNPFIMREYEGGESTVKMPPLTRDEVRNLAIKILGSERVTHAVVDKLASISSGHPLYLRYTLNQLSANPKLKLSSIQTYDADPDIYYRRIVGEILQDDEKCEFLGVLSRTVDAIREDFIREWKTPERVKQAVFRKMRHLFVYDEYAHTISFFHNSFRQYLLKETSRDWLTGNYNETKDKSYYEQLSQYAQSTLSKENWNTGIYLYRAERYDDFINQITPERLIDQIHHFRPLWHVQIDVKAATQIALKRDDPYMMIRYLLLQSQLSQMENQEYSSSDLIEPLLIIGLPEIARLQIYDGKVLHGDQGFALYAAKLFYTYNQKEDALHIFQLTYPDFMSEPIKVRKFDHDLKNHAEYMQEWIQTAVYFLPLDEIENKIALYMDHLRELANLNKEDFNEEAMLFSFKYKVIESLIDMERWPDMEQYQSTFNAQYKDYLEISTQCDKVSKLIEKRVTHDIIKPEFEKLQSIYATKKLQISSKAYLKMADFACKIGEGEDVIKLYLDKVQWHKLASTTKHVMPRDNFAELKDRIRYVELRAQSGYDDSISELVPDDGGYSGLMVSYLRKVYTLAKYKGKATQPGQSSVELMQLVRYYLTSFDSLVRNYETDAYSINEQRADFYAYLVKVVSAYGIEEVRQVGTVVQDLYKSGKWKAEEKAIRMIVRSLYEAGIDKEWAVTMIESIEETMFKGEDITSKQSEALAQGLVWLRLDEKDRASRIFQRMIEETFGVGYRKDYQPVTMAEWVSKANMADPNRAAERIEWIATRMGALYDSCESRTPVYAGERLLENAFDINLGMGLKFGRWLLDSEKGYFDSVSSIVIRKLLSKVQNETEYGVVFRYYTQIHLYIQDDRSEVDTSLFEDIYDKGKSLLSARYSAYVSELRQCINTQCFENVRKVLLAKMDELENPTPQAESIKIRDVDNPEDWMHESDRLEAKAKELLDAGDREGAWDAAMEALHKSNVYGWAKYNDGGTRINACGLLRMIDAEKGRQIAMSQIAEDISSSIGYGAMQYLDEIAHLLVREDDALKLFDEEMRYMHMILRANTVDQTDRPDLVSNNDGVIETMTRWLIYLMKMPIISLSERAKKLLAHQLRDIDYNAVELMQQEQCETRDILEVAMYVRELNGSLEQFKEITQVNAISANYLLRIYARSILNDLGEPLPTVPPKALSSIYYMAIQTLKAENPLYTIGTARQKIQYLSYLSGIEPINIATKAHMLLEQKGSIAGWDMIGKEAIQHYANISLRYPCRYFKIRPIHDSILEVAGELIDGGVIDQDMLDVRFFMSTDFSTITIPICPKPIFVHRLSKMETYMLPREWKYQAKENSRLSEPLVKLEGWSVIGERSLLCKPQDETAVEEYSMKISYIGYQDEDESFYESGCIVTREGDYTVERLMAQRLEFNPNLAMVLGWRQNPNEIGVWEDVKGIKMVKSVYWQSGNTNYRERSNQETGEGWYVLASVEAMESLKGEGDLYIHKRVIRVENPEYEMPTDSAYVIQKCTN